VSFSQRSNRNLHHPASVRPHTGNQQKAHPAFFNFCSTRLSYLGLRLGVDLNRRPKVLHEVSDCYSMASSVPSKRWMRSFRLGYSSNEVTASYSMGGTVNTPGRESCQAGAYTK
jgi:hypothetical protein